MRRSKFLEALNAETTRSAAHQARRALAARGLVSTRAKGPKAPPFTVEEMALITFVALWSCERRFFDAESAAELAVSSPAEVQKIADAIRNGEPFSLSWSPPYGDISFQIFMAGGYSRTLREEIAP